MHMFDILCMYIYMYIYMYILLLSGITYMGVHTIIIL